MRARLLLLTGLASLLGACAGAPPTTPAEAALQERSQRYSTTVATGAGAGGALGLLVGALACRGNAGCIAGATVAGGALGAGTGVFVADRNDSSAEAERVVGGRIAVAQHDNQRFAEDLAVLRQATEERRRSLASLQVALRQGSASRAQLGTERAALERNHKAAQRMAAEMTASSQRLAADITSLQGSAPGALLAQQQRLEQLRGETQQEVDRMAQALGALPPA